MRQWIEKNKVYFDSLTPVVLSVAALFVSIASYLVSKSQLDIQAEQLAPHFYISFSSDSSKDFTPNIEIRNDGGTYESLQVISMPFLSGFLVDNGAQSFNAPVFTHQSIVKSGQKKDLVATVKSDVPRAFLQGAEANQQKISILDGNPRVLLLLVWKTKGTSGIQFFADDEPVEAAKAESCYAYWHSKSEDSPSSAGLKTSDFAKYITSLMQSKNLQMTRPSRRTTIGCTFPS